MSDKKPMSHKERLIAGLVTHREGSRKSKVFAAFEKSEDHAEKTAKRLGLKDSTFKAWRRDFRLVQQTKRKPAKRKATKKTA